MRHYYGDEDFDWGLINKAMDEIDNKLSEGFNKESTFYIKEKYGTVRLSIFITEEREYKHYISVMREVANKEDYKDIREEILIHAPELEVIDKDLHDKHWDKL